MSVESFSAEIEAARELRRQLGRIEMTPPVDDDFPQVKYEYDQAVRSFLEAAARNGRSLPIPPLTQMPPLTVGVLIEVLKKLDPNLEVKTHRWHGQSGPGHTCLDNIAIGTSRYDFHGPGLERPDYVYIGPARGVV